MALQILTKFWLVPSLLRPHRQQIHLSATLSWGVLFPAGAAIHCDSGGLASSGSFKPCSSSKCHATYLIRETNVLGWATLTFQMKSIANFQQKPNTPNWDTPRQIPGTDCDKEVVPQSALCELCQICRKQQAPVTHTRKELICSRDIFK